MDGTAPRQRPGPHPPMSEASYRRLCWALAAIVMAVVIWGFHSPAEGPPHTRIDDGPGILCDDGGCAL